MTVFNDARPRVGARFFLGHGLGNDYLVMNAGEDWPAEVETVRVLCDRYQGVGSDGLVVVLDGPTGGPVELRMFNPDGSEFERSGNGLRIAASHLLREGRARAGELFQLRVGGDLIGMKVHGSKADGEHDVSVEMGRARTGPGAVELDSRTLDPGPGGSHGWLATSENGPLPVHLVSVGNPHCVVFVDALEPEHEDCFGDAALARIGPGLATHPGFAAGTNVQLARVLDRSTVSIYIWERGVGPTLASGTSSCAVAVAAVESGRCDPGPVRVEMPGGVLDVTVSAELDVVLRGPVREVCEGELAEGFMVALRALAGEVDTAH